MRKLHLPNDLHAAALIWMSRLNVIEQLLLRENRHLSDADIRSIISGCRLYATCHDDLFDQLAAEVEARQANVKSEAA
jgi:hypothetical protein